MKMKSCELHRGAVRTGSLRKPLALLALLCSAAVAQTAAAQTQDAAAASSQAAAQTPAVPARISAKVDEGNLVTLHGNVLARLPFPGGNP
jgi:hypothetical protein